MTLEDCWECWKPVFGRTSLGLNLRGKPRNVYRRTIVCAHAELHRIDYIARSVLLAAWRGIGFNGIADILRDQSANRMCVRGHA